MPGIAEMIAVFLRNRPSIADLLASRHPSFDRVHAILSSNAVTGEPVSATVQAWDGYERIYRSFEGSLEVTSTDGDATHPPRIDFNAGDEGVTTLDGVTFETPGIHYLEFVEPDSGERFWSNPVRVTATEPANRIYWGDIHLHSHLSDGAGSIEKGMRFGRDVMNLDVVAYTDHDTMGFFIPPQLQRRRMRRRYFDRMREVTEAFYEPGEFVTLFGYEWTKQPNRGGHLNVYFDTVEGAELFDSLSPESSTYEKLWDSLREFRRDTEHDVLTIPHHPAEETYPFDFANTDYDEDLAPLVEVYSQWGNSERPGEEGNPYPLEMGQGEIEVPGHYLQDALEMGHRVGMMASSDYHGPYPGHSLIHAPAHLPRLSEWREDGVGWGHVWRVWDEPSYPGGLTAFYAPELSREAIFESLRDRQVYGTTQPDRIVVEFEVAGRALSDPESEVILPSADAEREVSFEVAGTAPIERVTVVKNATDWRTVDGTTDPDADLDAYVLDEGFVDDGEVEGMTWDEERGSDADAYYLRVRQADGGMAWAGPIWAGRERGATRPLNE